MASLSSPVVQQLQPQQQSHASSSSSLNLPSLISSSNAYLTANESSSPPPPPSPTPLTAPSSSPSPLLSPSNHPASHPPHIHPSNASSGSASASKGGNTLSGTHPSNSNNNNNNNTSSSSISISSSISNSNNNSSTNNHTASSNALHPSVDYLRDLFQKRLHSFTYLKRSLSGKLSWFNTILLSQSDLSSVFDHEKMRKRTMRYTLLGLSLSSILEISTAQDMSKAILSLIQELDNLPDDSFNNKPRMKSFFKSSTKTLKRSAANQALSDFSVHDGSSSSIGIGMGIGVGGGMGVAPNMGSVNTGADYSYLVSPNIPFQLDFFQTFFTLCDAICEVYHKMISFLGSNADPVGSPIGPLSPGSASFSSDHGSSSTLLNPPSSGGIQAGSPIPPLPNSSERDGWPSETSPFSVAFVNGPALGGSVSSMTQDLMIKVDGKFKKIMSQQIKEIDALARQLIKEELSGLDPLMKDMGIPATNSAFSTAPSSSASSIISGVSGQGGGQSSIFGSVGQSQSGIYTTSTGGVGGGPTSQTYFKDGAGGGRQHHSSQSSFSSSAHSSQPQASSLTMGQHGVGLGMGGRQRSGTQNTVASNASSSLSASTLFSSTQGGGGSRVSSGGGGGSITVIGHQNQPLSSSLQGEAKSKLDSRDDGF
ncbi:hypothetical protein IE53DRAFT_245260 [Violaceomyces palustris]|uniref:Uncharacterized protein n=1 Tax=Violaceomyces palustris TaxID=1673888 RepID=A0ACD0NP08_9BASI|nr:hypothetical protein IE53DRAFT_245260 [Violaceomyces palustris]